MRFGIGMNSDHTLEQVGQQFSVTRERIRQIEAKALRKLKHPSRSRVVSQFSPRIQVPAGAAKSGFYDRTTFKSAETPRTTNSRGVRSSNLFGRAI